MNAPNTTTILQSLLFSMALTLLGAVVAIRLARRWNFLDFPGSAPHKQHTLPTPMAGGMALVLSMGISTFFSGSWQDPDIRALLSSSLIIFLAGVWDDLQELPPGVKLLGQGAAVILLIWQGVYIRIFESPDFFIHGQGGIYLWLNWLLTLLWMVGITNAFNFVDSMDGLAPALAGISAAFFVLASIDSGQQQLAQICVLLLGACIALYYFNAPPARLFLGDSGAQVLGFWLAALAIIYTPRGAFQTSSWFAPIMILGVPIFDTALVVFTRLRRGWPVYKSALDHTYHRLVTLGVEPNRAVMTMHVAALFSGCLAILVLNLPPLLANSVFALAIATGATTLFYLDRAG
jgi:UDP-GlcNAc:undecaprenyl-phosphate GlcNAc-1-phosphate transferase